MTYLERNSRLIAEVKKGIDMKRGENRGKGSHAYFSSVGSYSSDEVGADVYVGVKEPKESRRKFLKDRFIFELAVISVIAQNMPQFLPDLPLFYGLLVDKKNVPIAIVTEDFTKDGQCSVGKGGTPFVIYDLFISEITCEDYLANMAFHVSPKSGVEGKSSNRLGDFYPLLSYVTSNELEQQRELHRTRFPEEQIEADLKKYTIKTKKL